MTPTIGLVGFKQVGKSTAAKYLEEKYGFVRLNFKDALVAELKQNFPDVLNKLLWNEYIIDEEGYDRQCYEIEDLFKYKPPLMRALMQNYGTEVRRGDDVNYWTTQWRLKRAELYRQDKSVVVDDVRFRNEAEAVILTNGIIIRLTRPDLTTGGEHQSELEHLAIREDFTIDCKLGGTTKLYAELDKIMQHLSKERIVYRENTD